MSNKTGDVTKRNDHQDRLGSMVYSAKDQESLHSSSNGEFILYRVLIDEILQGKASSKSKKKSSLFEFFHPEDAKDKEQLQEYDQKYETKDAIFWYTKESPVYKILNKALRTQTTEEITPFSTFICDLNQQLADEHRKFLGEQSTSHISVYRGQFISKDEITRLKSCPGQFISMNSFLSTSTNRKKALEFATSRPPPTAELVSVLLEMRIDLTAASRPYANIQRLSAFPEEEEILFVVGCVFRIEQISFDEKQKLYMAKFTLVSEKDSSMNDFTATIDKDLQGQNRMVALAKYLLDGYKYDQAEKHVKTLLDEDQISDPIDFAYSFSILGQTEEKKGRLNAAKKHFHEALEYLIEKAQSKDHRLISECHNHLGSIYTREEDYPNAFGSYEKALNTPNNVSSVTFFGLADLHHQKGRFRIALHYLEKILEKKSELKESFLANVYLHMGTNLSALHEHDKAAEMFEKVTKTQSSKLSADHPDLSYSYQAMAHMFLRRDNLDQAALYFEKALEIQENSLPSHHHDFAEIYQSLGELALKRNDPSRAIHFYERRIENQLKTLSANHPFVVATQFKLGQLYWKTKSYEKASPCFHAIVQSDAEREELGESTSNISYEFIGDLYLHEYEQTSREDFADEAWFFYTAFVERQLKSKCVADPSFIAVFHKLLRISERKKHTEYSLVFAHRLIDCYEHQTPIDANEVDRIYQLIKQIFLNRKHLHEPFFHFSAKRPTDPAHFDDLYFEKRHLDRTSHYFRRRTKNNRGREEENNYLLGQLAFELGRFHRSRKYFTRHLTSQLTHKSPADPSLSLTYHSIAMIDLKQGHLQRSWIYFYRYLSSQSDRSSSLKSTFVDFARIFSHSSPSHLNSLDRQLIDPQLELHSLQRLSSFFSNLPRRSQSKFSPEELHTIVNNIRAKQTHLSQ